MAGLVSYGSSDEEVDLKIEDPYVNVSAIIRTCFLNASTDNADHR